MVSVRRGCIGGCYRCDERAVYLRFESFDLFNGVGLQWEIGRCMERGREIISRAAFAHAEGFNGPGVLS